MSATQKIAVLSNCSSQLLTKYLNFEADKKKMNICFKSFDYSRIILGVNSKEFNEYSAKKVIIIESSRVLQEEFLGRDVKSQKSFADEYFRNMYEVWKALTDKGVMVFQANFVEPPYSALGDFSIQKESSFLFQIRKLNYLLQEELAQQAGVFPIDILSYQLKHGYEHVFSVPFFYASMMPFSYEFTKELAEGILVQLENIDGRINKCLILDLDNVLWGGILSEDGGEGIVLNGLGAGRAYYIFRLWLKTLKERGVLLAVCSKNDEDMVKRIFDEAEDMVLRYEDFAVTKINWRRKTENIREIKEELGIGFDSIVFIDDSRNERGSVKDLFPDITVPDLPDDPALFIDFLSGLKLFPLIDADEMTEYRTQHFKKEKERKDLLSSSVSMEEYLTKLDMIGKFKQLTPEDVKRTSQLLLRANRFNLRTIRITEGELKKMLCDPNWLVYCVSLKDKYEDYGIVSVIIGKRTSSSTVFIYNWVVSCRAFERTLEQFVINCFVEEMKSKSVSIIDAEYIHSDKNGMVKNLYERLGFNVKGENYYNLILDEYSSNTTYVS